jgi:acetyl esterase
MLSPKLAPEIRGILEAMAAQGAPPVETLPVEEARKAAYGMLALAGEPEQVGRIEDRRIPVRSGEITVRIYTPEGEGPFPGVVFLHGGGWVICDLETHDTVCRAICRRANAVVVAVGYRLAPEHKFPVPLEDSEDATQWTAANAAALGIDPARLAIAGDSAGANMATVIAARARDARGPALALQVMVYPVTTLLSRDTASHEEFGEDHFLTMESMEWFKSNLLTNPEDARDPNVSPALLQDLRGLPPALVITAECDPLRDEGEAYAHRMQEAGVPVTLTRYAGMIHPFLNMLGATAGAQKAVDEIAAAVRNMAPAKAIGA